MPTCRHYQLTLPIFLLSIFFSLAPSICISADAPNEALRSFYQHINKQQCDAAILLRPDYSIERCQKISNTYIHKATTELSDNKNAVLLLELDSFYNKKKSYFFGYVRMAKKKEQWQIIGPFKSREDYWLDEYVETYIPGAFKDLPEALKKKKFIPPPAPNSLSIKELSTDPIKKNSITPGDSIDADEFSQVPTNTTKDKPANALSKTTPITTEAEKLLSGHYIIEGNYTSLLLTIRKHFPLSAKKNIILIDKSRNTLYLYNTKNLLLAFFPILSSDISSFPSGLYKTNSSKIVTSENTTQQANQAIILERKQTADTANTPLYYIRDLFDTDIKNSIQLSPIDNSKLQRLIASSAITYIGQ
jgi:hypothetical protein